MGVIMMKGVIVENVKKIGLVLLTLATGNLLVAGESLIQKANSFPQAHETSALALHLRTVDSQLSFEGSGLSRAEFDAAIFKLKPKKDPGSTKSAEATIGSNEERTDERFFSQSYNAYDDSATQLIPDPDVKKTDKEETDLNHDLGDKSDALAMQLRP